MIFDAIIVKGTNRWLRFLRRNKITTAAEVRRFPVVVRPGTSPLKIDGNWEDAVAKSFTKKKPKDGWPND